MGQPEIIQDDGGAVSSEAAAVQPQIQQPIVVVLGLLARRVQQEPALEVVALDADLDLERPDLVEPHHVDIGHQDFQQDIPKLPLGVVPENNPRLFLIENAAKRIGKLSQIHQPAFFPVTVLTSASRSPNLP